jgi:hypothetical protein
MTHIFRRALAVAVALSALGLTAGCGSNKAKDPKYNGTPDPRIQRLGRKPADGGKPAPGGEQPGRGGRAGPSASEN